ncbi:hypothetical protein OS493_023922 [Desmophyllum pertusum]|uniref:DUF7869 domain-containing protein n=1 Tax=Desmophyllum pertusum TaxID=174260 RepID=A0A9W9YDV0_9CNID|nr:hypothetical protein OS493_023922 [Desmophyllum pertusum]
MHRTKRNKYYKHGLRAKANPAKYLSVTLDGMDQSKHNLPHLCASTKVKFIRIENKYAVMSHYISLLFRLTEAPGVSKPTVTGDFCQLPYRYCTKAAAYVDTCEWPRDSNLTINVLLHVLLWMQTTVSSFNLF